VKIHGGRQNNIIAKYIEDADEDDEDLTSMHG